MGLHPTFPRSPYAPLVPEQRWFPANETLRATACEKLLPPLVANDRKEVYPLVEAIHHNLVKHPILPDTASRAKLHERNIVEVEYKG